MDAGSFAMLQRLIAMGGRSLLQYLSESSPFTIPDQQRTLARILAMAQEESAAVAKLRAYLQKKHTRPIVLGSYPMHYTTLNFMPIEHLVPKVREDEGKQIAVIETSLQTCVNEEVRRLIESYLEIHQRHAQELDELAQPTRA